MATLHMREGQGIPNIDWKKTWYPALSVVLAIVLFRSFTVVPAGHVGVIDLFGKVSDRSLQAGINFKNPFANVVKMSVKTQELKEAAEVPSKEGLNVKLEVSVLYHLDPQIAPQIYKTVGPDYASIILVPQLRSVIRGVTAGYEAKALYTAEREKVASEIQEQISNLVSARGIFIEKTPLRDVKLPARLTAAIEDKLKADQESQRMAFVLEKEEKEAQRKRIEGKGIADFQKIVSAGISDQLLRWKGIEATERLASSDNAKVVVVGAGKSGLPLILGK